MKNAIRAVGLAALAALLLGSTAQAQPPGQPRLSGSSPAYSPYLNLLRPGNTANNYYGLVRPQIDFQNQVNTLQQQYGALNQTANSGGADQQGGLPTTGHAARFMSYSGYYPGLGAGRGGGGGRPAGGGAATAPSLSAPSTSSGVAPVGGGYSAPAATR